MIYNMNNTFAKTQNRFNIFVCFSFIMKQLN